MKRLALPRGLLFGCAFASDYGLACFEAGGVHREDEEGALPQA